MHKVWRSDAAAYVGSASVSFAHGRLVRFDHLRVEPAPSRGFSKLQQDSVGAFGVRMRRKHAVGMGGLEVRGFLVGPRRRGVRVDLAGLDREQAVPERLDWASA